jgi:hypothetical protein
MALKNAVGDCILVYCILDSDYHTGKQKNERLQEAKKRGVRLHIWSRKEIENYLLTPLVIRRLIAGRMKEGVPPTTAEVEAKLLEFCEDEKETVLDGFAAEEDRALGVGGANKAARARLAAIWENPEKRLGSISGKSLLSKASAWSQKKYGVSFGGNAVAKKFRRNEVPAEVESVLQAIEEGEAFSAERNTGSGC